MRQPKAVAIYEPLSGAFFKITYWGYWHCCKMVRTNIKHSQGYSVIQFKGKQSLTHRVAWFLTHGYWAKEIDHINGNRNDNRLVNLRSVTRIENSKNACISKRNTSGYIGVGFDKKRNKWTASINVNYKRKALGYFDKKDEAITARKEAEVKYDFHVNHGRLS